MSNNIKPKKSKFTAFKETLWNPRNKTCLGRTKSSWAKLIAFYIVLYLCIAAIWTLFFQVFLLTINDRNPKWTLKESLIGTSPGLGIRPRSPHTDSALIRFNISDTGSINHYVSDLNQFFKHYESQTERNIECPATEESFCRFDIGGLPSDCRADGNYSFNSGTPCILIKLNRIIGWKPESLEIKPDSFPSDYPFDKNKVHITCEGQHDEDKELIGNISYHPNGIDEKYFPFHNQPGYQSPFVMARFENSKRNVLIRVECRAWANNILYDRPTQAGSIVFELFIESN